MWESINNNHQTASKIWEGRVAKLIFNQVSTEFIIIRNATKQPQQGKKLGNRGCWSTYFLWAEKPRDTPLSEDRHQLGNPECQSWSTPKWLDELKNWNKSEVFQGTFRSGALPNKVSICKNKYKQSFSGERPAGTVPSPELDVSWGHIGGTKPPKDSVGCRGNSNCPRYSPNRPNVLWFM